MLIIMYLINNRLFGMVECSPLVRLVAAVVLHHRYPVRWCAENDDMMIKFAKEDGFFVVTPAINAMISTNTAATQDSSAVKNGGEADAGAGGSVGSPGKRPTSPSSSRPSSPTSGVDEMEHRGLVTVAAKHNFLQLAEDVEHKYSDDGSSNHQVLTPNRHRAALLDMLSGDADYSSDENILASMLLATILENDAIDDVALELFGVLPSPIVNDEGDSPFETSIAMYLSQDWSIDSNYASLVSAIECMSTLGFMLLERLIFHTWTERGQYVDDMIIFEHYYKSSKLIQALGRCLASTSSRAQTYCPLLVREIFSDLIKQRYSDDVPDSPRSNDGSIKMICSLQSYYPSNFIDNASVLAGEIVYDGASSKVAPSAGDLFLFSNENDAAKFAIRSTLHLRSLLGCIQDFYQRFTSPRSIPSKRWYGEGESLSFRTTEEADDILLSIGCIQTSSLPDVGTDIDLRGRKFFRCLLPRKKFANVEIIINVNGTQIVVTEKVDLVLVVDPSEIYVAKTKKGDANRCTVLAVVPLQLIIASATEVSLPLSLP